MNKREKKNRAGKREIRAGKGKKENEEIEKKSKETEGK